MHLKRLSLLNYKNFDTREFEFDAKINCLIGPNGVGKTNVLDSIYHLAFGKSYFNPVTTQNIRHGEEFFVIEGVFVKEGGKKVWCAVLKKAAKKYSSAMGKSTTGSRIISGRYRWSLYPRQTET